MMRKIQRVVMLGGKKIEDMTEMEARELAMLVDTDGSISSSVEQHGNYGSPDIIVQMASLLPVYMAEKWGGTIYKRKPKGEKLQYRWVLGRREIVPLFLQKIKDHLKVKQEQADLALRMFEILLNQPEEWREKANSLGEELSRLKHLEPPDIDLTELKGAHPVYQK